MPALSETIRAFLNEQELIEVRTRVTWKSIALIVHAWTLILGAIALVAIWPNPLTFILAVAIIGSRQLGLMILMHDGTHGLLANGVKLNMARSAVCPGESRSQATMRVTSTSTINTPALESPAWGLNGASARM